jgi:hypothetical protein
MELSQSLIQEKIVRKSFHATFQKLLGVCISPLMQINIAEMIKRVWTVREIYDPLQVFFGSVIGFQLVIDPAKTGISVNIIGIQYQKFLERFYPIY